MYQIEMTDENILVTKVETKATTQFETGGDSDKRGAVYRVNHAPSESAYKADQLVLLKPGTYPGLFFEGETMTVIEESDIIANVTEGAE